MTQRSAFSGGLPAPSQVIELLSGEFARAGYEVEDVGVVETVRPPRITVIADGDVAPDLDTVTELSRVASELLDTVPGLTAAYVLEVTSPGVERPLTAEKHFRRARTRKVELVLQDGASLSGRVAGVADGVLRLVVRTGSDWSVRDVALADIAKAVVQVEFSKPSARELELVDQTGREAGQ